MNNLLQHVAIIMDGNRRWAKLNSLSYEEGYKKATVAIKEAVGIALEKQIPYLTLFAFSTDNNNRSNKEILILKKLIKHYLNNETKNLIESGVKFNVIGDYYGFDKNLALELDNLKNNSKQNKKLNLNIALNYSGKADLLQAINKIIFKKDVQKSNTEVTSAELEENLFTANIPNPDILIRTGGNNRISNFFLWQMAYTELFFLEVLWPDFTKQHFTDVINKFQSIERKYGK